jgi:hypothetical protein
VLREFIRLNGFNNMNKEFENILDKVSVLYSKYGIKSITMDDVAHELGISKKTLYQRSLPRLQCHLLLRPPSVAAHCSRGSTGLPEGAGIADKIAYI